jgi:hypothetical protein
MKQIYFLFLALMLSIGTVWAGIPPEFSVANDDRILISYTKCEKWLSQCDGNGLIVTWPETGAIYADEIIIPASVTYEGITYSVIGIGTFVFSNIKSDCSNLKGIGIPESVYHIDSDIFYKYSDTPELTALTDIYVSWSDPSTVTIQPNTFSYITASNITLHVPIGAKAAYESSDIWKVFNIVDDGKTSGERGDGVARLANITTSYGTLSPAFSATQYAYRLVVPLSVDRITLTAIPLYGGTASGDGEKTLNIGENTFEITATAVDGTLRTYTVTVLRLEVDILLSLTSSLRQTGNVYFTDYMGNHLYVQDQTLLKYRLITGNVSGNASGNVALHFAAGSQTLEQPVTLLPNAIYDMYVRMWINKTGVYCTTYFTLGRPSSSALIYPNQTTETMAVSIGGGQPMLSSLINVLGPTQSIELYDLSLQGTISPIAGVNYDASKPSLHASADRLTLTGLQGNETLRIYSIAGNLLLSDTATGETTAINIAHLPAGIYLVGIQGDKGVSTHKIIKQ